MKQILVLMLFLFFILPTCVDACSIFYYIDQATGKIYVVNNEDYYYNVKSYIQINPKTDKTYARLVWLERLCPGRHQPAWIIF